MLQVNRFNSPLAAIRRFFAGASDLPPTGHRESVWYAGLIVDPNDFSRQLVTLQDSLQRESSLVKTRQ